MRGRLEGMTRTDKRRLYKYICQQRPTQSMFAFQMAIFLTTGVKQIISNIQHHQILRELLRQKSGLAFPVKTVLPIHNSITLVSAILCSLDDLTWEFPPNQCRSKNSMFDLLMIIMQSPHSFKSDPDFVHYFWAGGKIAAHQNEK